MVLVLIGIIIYLINVVLSLIFAVIIIDKLYLSKKISNERHFHFYNELFSWEIFYFFIGIENIIEIFILFISFNNGLLNLIIRIRILIFFFPFWNKIIHLEKIMNKITYEKHYFAGIIPSILVLALGFTNLPNLVLIFIFFGTTFCPFLILFIFFKNTGTKPKKTLKIIFGAIFIGMGYFFRPEIMEKYGGISEFLDVLIKLSNISTPILFVIGTLLIFESFRKELNSSI